MPSAVRFFTTIKWPLKFIFVFLEELRLSQISLRSNDTAAPVSTMNCILVLFILADKQYESEGENGTAEIKVFLSFTWVISTSFTPNDRLNSFRVSRFPVVWRIYKHGQYDLVVDNSSRLVVGYQTEVCSLALSSRSGYALSASILKSSAKSAHPSSFLFLRVWNWAWYFSLRLDGSNRSWRASFVLL